MRVSTAAIIIAFTAGMSFAAPTGDPNASKREAEPQCGRCRRIGDTLEGVADDTGIVSDALLINDIANQKREAQLGRDGRIDADVFLGDFAISDASFFNDIANRKREAQLGRIGPDVGFNPDRLEIIDDIVNLSR